MCLKREGHVQKGVAGDIFRDNWKMAADSFCHRDFPETILVRITAT